MHGIAISIALWLVQLNSRLSLTTQPSWRDTLTEKRQSDFVQYPFWHTHKVLSISSPKCRRPFISFIALSQVLTGSRSLDIQTHSRTGQRILDL